MDLENQMETFVGRVESGPHDHLAVDPAALQNFYANFHADKHGEKLAGSDGVDGALNRITDDAAEQRYLRSEANNVYDAQQTALKRVIEIKQRPQSPGTNRFGDDN